MAAACPNMAPRSARGAAHLLKVLLSEQLEFLEVVLRVRLFIHHGWLTNDRVKEIAVLRHASATRRAQIVLRMEQNVAICVASDANHLGHQELQPVWHTPTLPVAVAETKRRFRTIHALHIDTHGLLQILIQHAQHLIRLANSHPQPLLQTEVIAQARDGTHGDTGDRSASKIDRYAVSLGM